MSLWISVVAALAAVAAALHPFLSERLPLRTIERLSGVLSTVEDAGTRRLVAAHRDSLLEEHVLQQRAPKEPVLRGIQWALWAIASLCFVYWLVFAIARQIDLSAWAAYGAGIVGYAVGAAFRHVRGERRTAWIVQERSWMGLRPTESRASRVRQLIRESR